MSLGHETSGEQYGALMVGNPFYGDYFMPDKVLEEHSAKLIDAAMPSDDVLTEQRGIHAVVCESPLPGSVFSTLARTLELQAGFKEMPKTMRERERNTSFLFLLDYGDKTAAVALPEVTEQPKPRIAHILRILNYNPDSPTGFEVLDDFRDQISPEEVKQQHEIPDLTLCLDIASNFATKGTTPSFERPHTLLAYKALFLYARERNITHLFSYQNPPALKSLKRLEIQMDPLASDRELVIPKIEGHDFSEYKPFCIPANAHNVAVFSDTSDGNPSSSRLARSVASWTLSVDLAC